MRLACAVAITRFSTRVNPWSPGLGVSGIPPGGAPGQVRRRSRPARVTPKRARMSSASPIGGRVGRAGPGGDVRGIVAGHVRDHQREHARAGRQRRAARPGSRDRCLRTVFMSWIGAPLASSSRVTALRSAIATPSTGSDEQARAAARHQHEQQIVRAERARRARGSRCAASSPASSGTGCPASTTRMRLRGQPVAVAGDHQPLERRPAGQAARPQRPSRRRPCPRRRRACGPPAAPAGAQARSRSGSAAASAARKLPSERARAGVASSPEAFASRRPARAPARGTAR